MAGLRERKKRQTMHHVQDVALRLFSERGFSRVTVEEVAAEAGVSPSTIYRYFGTKEALVIRDEYDDEMHGLLARHLRAGVPPAEAVKTLIGAYTDEFAALVEFGRRRGEIALTEPSVTRAMEGAIRAYVDGITDVLIDIGWDPLEARVTIASLVWGFMAALEQWWKDGAGPDMQRYLERGMEVATRSSTS